MSDTLYKWLLNEPDGTLVSPVRKTPWRYALGEWTPVVEHPVLCEAGWHGTREKDVLAYLPQNGSSSLYVVEAIGVKDGEDKFTSRSMRLVSIVGEATDRNLRLFACDVAEDVLSAFKTFRPNDTRVRDCIEVARRYARGATAESAALSAAEYAALSAAQSAAESALSAAESAAESAQSAAWYAAWSAAQSARSAAGSAAESARSAAESKYSLMLIVRLGDAS
jgi:hypothetical protein